MEMVLYVLNESAFSIPHANPFLRRIAGAGTLGADYFGGAKVRSRKESQSRY